MTANCPKVSEIAIIADDAYLAAQLSCALATPETYLPILEQPRLTRLDRDAEIIRCTNALARSKFKYFIFAGLGDITSAALSVSVPTQKTINVRTSSDISSLPFPVRTLKKEPLIWGKDRVGIGLLKHFVLDAQLSLQANHLRRSRFRPNETTLLFAKKATNLPK